ncbi:MAG: hypothetical protein LBV69_07450 [Bacteroidales bacterium]|nr:hypothetical protein [Bacteroidales bacterium]
MIQVGIYCEEKINENLINVISAVPEMKVIGYYSANHFSQTINQKICHFNDYQELLKKVDAMIILSYDYLSDIELTIKKLKHVYLLHSQNINIDEIIKLYNLSCEADINFQTSVLKQIYNPFPYAKPFIEKPRYIETSFHKHIDNQNDSEQELIEMIFEDLYFLLSINSKRVKNISTNISSINNAKPDIINVRLEFYNGSIANMTVGLIATQNSHKLKIYDKNKLVDINIIENKSWLITKKNEKSEKNLFNEHVGNLVVDTIPESYENQYCREIREFASTILSNEKNKTNIDLLINTYTIKNAILSKLYLS